MGKKMYRDYAGVGNKRTESSSVPETRTRYPGAEWKPGRPSVTKGCRGVKEQEGSLKTPLLLGFRHRQLYQLDAFFCFFFFFRVV